MVSTLIPSASSILWMTRRLMALSSTASTRNPSSAPDARAARLHALPRPREPQREMKAAALAHLAFHPYPAVHQIQSACVAIARPSPVPP